MIQKQNQKLKLKRKPKTNIQEPKLPKLKRKAKIQTQSAGLTFGLGWRTI
jgi:hypothetical protein